MTLLVCVIVYLCVVSMLSDEPPSTVAKAGVVVLAALYALIDSGVIS